MRLSTRLTIAMVTLVILTATAIGVLNYRNVAALALPRSLDRLNVQTRLLGLDLESSQRDARSFVLGAAAAGPLQGMIRARVAGGIDPVEGLTEAVWAGRLAALFLAEIRPRPDYFQIRMIGVDDGRELVRVERAGPNRVVRVVPDAELARRDDQSYFRETIGLPAGEVYISPIDLSRGNPEKNSPRIPEIHVATPVYMPDGRPFGIVMTNIDLRPVLTRIRSAARNGAQVFVVNTQGDYLVHPDPAKEFGFEFGKPARLQDELPEFAQMLSANDTTPSVVTDVTGERFGLALNTVRIADGPEVTVVETMPYPLLIVATALIRNVSLLGGLAAVLCAGLLSAVIARSLTNPLVQVTKAVAAFGRNETMSVPIDASGEIGILARAFAAMATQVRSNTAALRKEIEDRQIAEEKFRLAVEGSPSGQIMADSSGAIVLVNAEVERLFGYGREELIGQPIEMLVAPDLRFEHREHRMRFAADPKVRRMGTGHDLFGIRKDGARFEVGLNPINTANGLFVLGQVVDISERKRAEAKLRQYAEQEQLFIAAVDSSDDAIVTKTLDGIITGWNSGAERLFGYQAVEAIGQPIDIIVPAELRSDVPPILDKVARGEKIEHHETVRVSREGRRIDVSLSISPVKSASGAIIGAAKVARDIGAKNKARDALLESEQMARGVIDSSLDAFVQLDEAGLITDWNPQAAATFGWSRAEAIGQNLGALIIAPAQREMHEQRIGNLLTTAQNSTVGVRFHEHCVRRDGKNIVADVAVTAIRRRSGFVFNGFVRDITEKIAAEEQLRQAQKMEAVGQLTGGIAHDFNNMLTVITGTIDILAAEVAHKPRLAAIAKLISEAADRGAELTNRLLIFARKQPLQPQETEINALMADTEKLIRATLGAQIEIEQKLEPSAWRAMIDPTQLTTAIMNLAVNARDAMPDGGKLTLETANVCLDENYAKINPDVCAGEYVMIAVSDTGAGIPEDIRDKVFEPFFSTKEVGKGTGLGLSMVYGFVKQSGGHIKIYSEVGHGTTIKLYLPRTATSANPLLATKPPDRVKGGQETILIVEDDKLVLSYVTAQIEGLGYTVLSAANAAEALALIDSGVQFDLLFTDVMMPGLMNGRQLASEVVKRRSSLPVLFTSGYTENAMLHHGRLDPGVHLLAKPYRRPELARMIRLVIDGAPDSRHSPTLRNVG
jgi:PAS domain S-box-containing protein